MSFSSISLFSQFPIFNRDDEMYSFSSLAFLPRLGLVVSFSLNSVMAFAMISLFTIVGGVLVAVVY